MTSLLDDYRWLTGDAARAWLGRAAEAIAAGTPLVQLVQALRKDLASQRVHLVLEQVELRRRGLEKFSRAAEMFFTSRGLEQATDEVAARYKAQRFGAVREAADLCCGIGGDLLALGQGRRCMGIDRDPVAAHLAQANAEALGLKGVAVTCGEIAAAAIEPCEAWHIDPDRRPEGKRTVRSERFEPPWSAIEELLARCGNAAVKVAPATELEEDAAACEREWIETRGECRQQVAWFGSLAKHPGQSSATIVDATRNATTIVGQRGAPFPLAGAIGRYVYEPCAAIRAARLLGAFCQRSTLAALSAESMYLTADARLDDPLAAAFEVLEWLPFDLRRLREVLRARKIGRVEVKKRGADVDPDRVRRELASEEGESGVVLIAPISGRTMAIVARRLSSPSGG